MADIDSFLPDADKADGTAGAAVPTTVNQVGGKDGSGNLQPLKIGGNGSLLTSINGATDNTAIGNTSDSLKTNVTNSSGASAVNIQDGGNSITVDGSVTVTQATGTNLHTVIDSGTVAATQSGTWNITNVSGTVSLPTGAATATNQTTEITALQLIDNPVGSSTGGTAGTSSFLSGGIYNSTLPTLTNGQQSGLQFDSTSRLIISPVQSSPLPASGSGFSFGQVATNSSNQFAVESTTYNEPTVNAQRSIASANAADTSAGTGARTVKITYYDQTGAGPFTETVTLNGTTGVNTVSTTICFIENIMVVTAGSSGSNTGIITLYTAINKGGTVIGTIGALVNQTFWAHHYVSTGKTCYISGLSFSSSATAGGNGAVFYLKESIPTVANSISLQISDFNHLFGQSSNTTTRTYVSPIQVAGPARITAYVLPDAGAAVTQYASFDFIDV